MSRIIVPRRDLILPNRRNQGGFIISPYQFATGGGAGGYLNGLAVAPLAALGLKKLTSTATIAIRVRRSSDNAEQDIGFSGTSLDTTALATFVGANSGYVVKFYDQTGNGYDLAQATASKQPRIVNAGVYDGKATWDGADDAMKITALGLSQPQAAIYANGAFAVSSSVGVFIESSANWNSNPHALIYYTFNNGHEAGMNSGTASTQRAIRFNSMSALERNLSLLWDRSLTGVDEIKAYQDGSGLSATPQSSNEMSGSFTANDIHVGGRGGASLYGAMSLSSLVFYNADTASVRADIEALIA